MSEIKEVKKDIVPVRGLHYRFIPVLTPEKFWNNDMSIENSQHVELMRIFQQYGLDWKRIHKSRYWGQRLYWYEAGMKQWTPKYAKQRITIRYKIFKSILKHGFKDKPVKILKQPIWTSRFGYRREWLRGPEIYDGGGRSAAAFVLGIEKIPAIWCIDKAPASGDKGKWKKKLKNVKGIWKCR